MPPVGIVTEYLRQLIEKQVNDNGIVVWYDPDGAFSEVVKIADLPNTDILCYQSSFVQLRREIDQKKLMDGEDPPRILIYVPMAQDQTCHALVELEAAGVIMQPGQQPPQRNTRLAVLARNALKGILSDETVANLEKQTEAGKLGLADLNALAEKGGEISQGVLPLVFGTGNPKEVALLFLDSDRLDDVTVKKNAKGELIHLLRREFGLDTPEGTGLAELRQCLSRHILLTEFVSGLGNTVPSKLTSVPVAITPETIRACVELSQAWRMRRDMRQSYVQFSRQIEKEYDLGALDLDLTAISEIETFQIVESALLRQIENRLLDKAEDKILALANSRLSRFWCDVEPWLQARWALVSSAAEVLLEADRLDLALKAPPASISGLIKEYAEGTRPWCALDTHHRHMESRWSNFELHGHDHDSIEKLVIKARQRYSEVGSLVARYFLSQLQKDTSGKGILSQRWIFEKYVKPSLGKERLAYVWVDALRFEMARELARLLKDDFEVDLKPALAVVPTITEIGMAALLPSAQACASVVSAGGGKLALEINGTIIKDRKDRIEFLKKHAGVKVFEAKLDDLLPKPSKKVRESLAEAELILVTSQEIDELCEQDNLNQARRQMDGVLNDLRRGIRVLLNMGVQRIVLAADHGHIFAEELSEDMKIDSPGGETADLHRRVWVGKGGNADAAFLRIPLSAFGIDGDFDLATPWSFACFKCKGGARAYFHGGLSPQELIVPVMILLPSTKNRPGASTKFAWKLMPGSQKLTTRFFSVQISGYCEGLFDFEPPKVRVELVSKGKTVSKAVSASYGFAESTGDVALMNNKDNPKEIIPNTVALMVVEELQHNTVGLHLFEAATGIELARLDKIDVAIAI